ncbi:MAG: hypothetical protein ACQEQV_07610, partial [Fibrobacterota bacterium]
SDYLSRVTGEISRNLTQTLSLSLQGSAESVTHTLNRFSAAGMSLSRRGRKTGQDAAAHIH